MDKRKCGVMKEEDRECVCVCSCVRALEWVCARECVYDQEINPCIKY